MIYGGNGGHLDDAADMVRQSAEALRPYRASFRCLVATGMSGVIVASPLALRLRRPLVVVRKHNDGSHGQNRLVINPDDAAGPYVMIDDFISTGRTYHHVRKAMRAYAPEAVYAGAYLYGDNELLWEGDRALTYYPNGFFSYGERYHVRYNGCPGVIHQVLPAGLDSP
jgi:adenine/guanine phosphoribosyltransferase-like PRPP-binding protein